MKRVKNHPAADADLFDATRWVSNGASQPRAEFIREPEHAINRIAETPDRYPRTRLGFRRLVLMNDPFDIVYREHAYEIEVAAVAHHARKPMYWRRR